MKTNIQVYISQTYLQELTPLAVLDMDPMTTPLKWSWNIFGSWMQYRSLILIITTIIITITIIQKFYKPEHCRIVLSILILRSCESFRDVGILMFWGKGCGLKAHLHDINTTAITIFLDAVVDCSWLPLNTHPISLLMAVLSHVEVLAVVIVEKCNKNVALLL